MENKQARFLKRDGIVCWKMGGKEDILGYKTAAGFWWSRKPQSRSSLEKRETVLLILLSAVFLGITSERSLRQ